MAHGKPRDPYKEQHWRRLIQLWKNSGLSVRAFCARYHITQTSFYAWRRELQKRDAAATTFVPVRIVLDQPPTSATPIEVVLNGGRRLRVASGFDPATLRHLLEVLEEASSC
jgi:transposase-like protein